MAVSAYWHGIHPGYYLSFLTVPLSMIVNHVMYFQSGDYNGCECVLARHPSGLLPELPHCSSLNDR